MILPEQRTSKKHQATTTPCLRHTRHRRYDRSRKPEFRLLIRQPLSESCTKLIKFYHMSIPSTMQIDTVIPFKP